jgi:hypothetical protein
MNSKIGLILLPFVFAGCSSTSSNTTTATPNAFSSALTALQSATPDFTGGASSFSPVRSAIDSNWNVTNSFTSVDTGALTSTMVQHMGDLLNDESDNAIFSRAKTPFLISCTIDQLATRTGSNYTTGTQNLVISAASLTMCGTSDQYGSVDGTTVVAVITDLSDTTYYDQKVVLTSASNSQFGGKDQVMFLRNNSTTLNFVHVETDSLSAATDTFVTVINYDKASESGAFQYASINGNARYLYRIVMDQTQNLSSTFTHFKDTAPRVVTTHVGSQFTSQAEAVASISWSGLTGSPIGAAGTDNNGCIDTTATPPTVSADDSLTCAGNSVSISAVSTNTIAATFNSLTPQDLADIGANDSAGAGFVPTFTNTTILSAALGF